MWGHVLRRLFWGLGVTFTRQNHDITRKSFKAIDKENIEALRTIVKGQVITDESVLPTYNTDWLRCYEGNSRLVVLPGCVDEVAKVLKYCNKNNIAVCPQGGKTGLVGGSVPVFDEVILSTRRMNKIISFEETSGILQCEAGCILENLDGYVQSYNHIVPLDLGSRGSCNIGGNISTNAGGLKLIRYGNIHSNLTGLEVVLADGTVLNLMSSMMKDNTGYHLKNLFVGSEGTLGVITKVALRCIPKYSKRTVVFLGLPTFDKVLETFKRFKSGFYEVISSFEFLDNGCIECLNENTEVKNPIGKHKFYILIELCYHLDTDKKIEEFLAALCEEGIVSDGVVAMAESQVKKLWAIREQITGALLLDGYCYKYDVSVPLTVFYDVVGKIRSVLTTDAIRCVGFGHIGDSNLHLNVTSKTFKPDLKKAIETNLYEWVSRQNGSISAEHGIGVMKSTQLHYSKTLECISTMRKIKFMLDKKGILNPYKVITD